ncbi:MAG: diaminopimelate decarboxylase [Candidatus Nanohalobium sp.]
MTEKLEIGGLEAENVAEEYGTPLYVYDFNRINDQYRRLSEAFAEEFDKSSVNYAVKANPNPSVLSLLSEEGAGFDCASRAELELALKFNDPENIIYTAPFPPQEELEFAAEKNVTLNFNSIKAFERAEELSERVSFRIDPGIGQGSFGLELGGGSKFGVEEENALEAYRKAKEAGVERFGIHVMTGSGVLEAEYFGRVTRKLCEIAENISEELDIEFEFIDIGGGLGVPYRPEEDELDVEKVAENVSEALEGFDLGNPEVMMEPGRFLVAQSGTLIAQVQDVLEKEKTYVGLDSGMHHFLRPMLYDAYHEIEAVNPSEDSFTVDVVGLVCENTDTFAEDREISKVGRGDLLAIRDVGAYGFAMASNWNTRPMPPEVKIEDGGAELVREGQDWSDVFHGTGFEVDQD